MKRNRPPSRQTLSVLEMLIDDPLKWCYGYEISRVTQLKSGTLYPILMRLSDRDFLESKWEMLEQVENTGRPPRHLYRLTKQGTAFAKEQLAMYGCIADTAITNKA